MLKPEGPAAPLLLGMRNAWPSRIGALLLALLVAGGGMGLPLVDAFLHHLHDAPAATAHVASGGTPAVHGESCTLGAAKPVMVRAGASPDPVTKAAPLSVPVLSFRPAPLPADAPPAATRPRAPPASIA